MSTPKLDMILETNVAGLQFYEFDDKTTDMAAGDEVDLKPEPSNPHDNRAIEVYWNTRKLGYIPRDNTELIHKYLTRDNHPPAKVFSYLTFIQHPPMRRLCVIAVKVQQPAGDQLTQMELEDQLTKEEPDRLPEEF